MVLLRFLSRVSAAPGSRGAARRSVGTKNLERCRSQAGPWSKWWKKRRTTARRSQSPIAPTRATRGEPTQSGGERSETKQKRPSEIRYAMLQRAGASSGPSSELRRLVEEEDGARSDVAALLHDGENALETSTEGGTRGSAGREPGLSAGEMDEESLLGMESRSIRARDSEKWLGPCSVNVSATAVGFWLLGLMNNATFVIMNAGAKEIFAEGVGGVYLANVLPSLFVKASAPFWFHLVPYHVRVTLCAALTVACLSTVALGQSLGVQLFGVAVGAFAGSLGEASFLAYSAFFDGPTALTAWSSGTGFAGVFGYFWVVFLTKALGFTFRASLLLAMVLPGAFLFVFFRVLAPARAARGPTPAAAGRTREAHHDWSAWERVQIFASLWEFTVPLFLVYFAEYAMQSGTWAAIGFPIDSKAARDDFYVFANWLYQVGVFVSRSSGTLLRLSKRDLWLMPVLQMVLLVFFTANGVWHFWWNQSLFALAFVVGLLGGAVYVHGYILISREVAPERKEFALASASLADTLGIMLANMTGVIIQGCLYAVNDLTDEGRPPAFTCGKKYD